jgi:putative ABC transport system ATP-binding protein
VSLELRDVSRKYGELTVLREVSLSVGQGELVAVAGPSGSGKTTLLQIMGTLDRPTAGSVHVAGQDLTGMSDRRLSAIRAFHIGFVFQQFFLDPVLSAVDNVATGLLYRGVPARERRARAVDTLRRVGLADRLRHRPAQLSGGERQRVAIARAVLGDPEVVLADEPTGNLDSRSGAAVVELLRDLNAGGTTVIVITHDTRLADSMPRQIRLRDGAVT